MSLHREGYRYILIATLAWMLLGYLCFLMPASLAWLAWAFNVIFFLLWAWVIWFFRLPKRQFELSDQKIMAPADGKVVVIEETFEPEYFKDKRLQISVFMSPLNVHVNRCPISGTIKYKKYHPGKYLVAWHPKSSTENERTTLVIENDRMPILLRQVAGALARRICLYAQEGQKMQQHEEFGFIRFGSRVDVYLPIGTPVDVKIGDTVQGGLTTLAHLP
ncbi:MAG: phosphatidylserine decarboxylase family protein [Bacteroidetes bacterium]|nr:phosphatidylserine decarboxylase family protein [Bacteroidota bacterium]MBS1629067.1 phosphatidylserine decarboxylase family protein [Bacteroidota bacterium]